MQVDGQTNNTAWWATLVAASLLIVSVNGRDSNLGKEPSLERNEQLIAISQPVKANDDKPSNQVPVPSVQSLAVKAD